MRRFLWEQAVLWHCRLTPAVPFGVAGALAVGMALGVPRTAPPDAAPPAGRALLARDLAAEQAHPVARSRGPDHEEPVDVIDAQAAPPRRIAIPAIGLSAPVVALGRNADGTMQTPRDFARTGWYEPGPEPGEGGAAVIAGHVDSRTGPAVFFRLSRLRRGAQIRVIRADGSVVRFRVEGLERWPKARFPTRRVFRRTRVSALRLVTCSGAFDSGSGHYVDNTIVYAVRETVARRALPRGPA